MKQGLASFCRRNTLAVASSGFLLSDISFKTSVGGGDTLNVKRCSNELATSRKFGQALRALALTCDHFGPDQICTQVNASFLPFGHPTQVSSKVQLAATSD